MNAIKNLILFILYVILMTITVIGIPFLIIHLVLLFKNSKERIQEAKKKLENNLIDNEKIVVCAEELKPYALFNRRSLIAITNSRIILIKRHRFGGFKMSDIQWKDLTDAQISQNIFPNFFGSSISISYFSQDTKIVKRGEFLIDINKDLASKIYQYAQKQEQAWEEKRRVREIEETRAAAGGTYITPAQTAPSSSNSNSVLDEIKKAKEMLDEGIISDVEFNELKSKILNQGKSL